MTPAYKFPSVLQKNYEFLLADWIKEQHAAITHRRDLIKDAELEQQSKDFLKIFLKNLETASIERIDGDDWRETRYFIEEVSQKRIELGFSSSDTATFIFSLKQPVFSLLGSEFPDTDRTELFREIWGVSSLLDKIGLYAVQSYQKTREAIIQRQQQALLELSTPVVQLWEGILAVPLIGTLDIGRTQVVMETLLQKIVETGSEIAIIDITGVPAVDTLVAQHLLKTISATRLMGAECIISGIRPEIAQTIVHLGVDLSSVVTKSSLAAALKLAMKMSGLKIEKNTRKDQENTGKQDTAL